MISVSEWRARFLPELTAQPDATPEAKLGRFDLHAETHREVDRILRTLTLRYTGGNHRVAAKLLGISRQTMRVRMRAPGLHVAHSVESDDDAD